jgi:hypothetical protein
MSQENTETKKGLEEIGTLIGIKTRARINQFAMKIIGENVTSHILVRRVILDAVTEDHKKMKKIEIIEKGSLTTINKSGNKNLI